MSEKAEYMRQYRQDNADYAERNRNQNRARARALGRLRDKHPADYALFEREELEKMRTRGMKI
jgi:hypothetical protein